MAFYPEAQINSLDHLKSFPEYLIFPFSKCALQSSVLNVQNGFGYLKIEIFEKFKPTK